MGLGRRHSFRHTGRRDARVPNSEWSNETSNFSDTAGQARKSSLGRKWATQSFRSEKAPSIFQVAHRQQGVSLRGPLNVGVNGTGVGATNC